MYILIYSISYVGNIISNEETCKRLFRVNLVTGRTIQKAHEGTRSRPYRNTKGRNTKWG